MQLGIVTPVFTRVPGSHASWESEAGIEDAARIAVKAEELGYHHVTCSEHVAIPTSAAPVRGARYYDPLATFGFLAAQTTRLRFVTHVLVLPYHHPLAIAKRYGTLDRLSGGRLVLGVGVGTLAEEFALLGAPFADRGTATDEYLEAFKALWTQERPAYRGTHVSFADVIFSPKPLQKPHPPIWVGGESPAALRRTIALGDTWYPANNNQTKPLDTPSRLGAAIGELRRLAQARGRDPASVRASLLVQNPFEWTAQKTQDGTARRLFTGSSADMLADAAALEAIGVGHVAIRLGGDSPADAVERIERFGRDVIGSCGRA